MSLGFIVLRHVNNELTNKYWIKCYDCIRKHYPENEIIIIDDNSNYEFITHKDLYKTLIINSEYHQRGELLPYYYYLRNKLFDTAIILHDSVFLMKPINSKIIENIKTVRFLWHFQPHIPVEEEMPTSILMPKTLGAQQKQLQMINLYNDKGLIDFFDLKLWNGCFGGMSIISQTFLVDLNNKYDLSKLLDVIFNRAERQCFERVIGCLFLYFEFCFFNYNIKMPTLGSAPSCARKKAIKKFRHNCIKYVSASNSIFGNIMDYPKNVINIKNEETKVPAAWRFTFENCWECSDFLPIIKIWSGR